MASSSSVPGSLGALAGARRLSTWRDNPVLSFLNDAVGVRGARNIAAWAVAGGIAYWLWIVPMQQEEARRKVRACDAAPADVRARTWHSGQQLIC